MLSGATGKLLVAVGLGSTGGGLNMFHRRSFISRRFSRLFSVEWIWLGSRTGLERLDGSREWVVGEEWLVDSVGKIGSLEMGAELGIDMGTDCWSVVCMAPVIAGAKEGSGKRPMQTLIINFSAEFSFIQQFNLFQSMIYFNL